MAVVEAQLDYLIELLDGDSLYLVAICHVPQNNPEAAHIKFVSQQAVRAHLQHYGNSYDWLIADGVEVVEGDSCDAYQG